MEWPQFTKVRLATSEVSQVFHVQPVHRCHRLWELHLAMVAEQGPQPEADLRAEIVPEIARMVLRIPARILGP